MMIFKEVRGFFRALDSEACGCLAWLVVAALVVQGVFLILRLLISTMPLKVTLLPTIASLLIGVALAIGLVVYLRLLRVSN